MAPRLRILDGDRFDEAFLHRKAKRQLMERKRADATEFRRRAAHLRYAASASATASEDEAGTREGTPEQQPEQRKKSKRADREEEREEEAPAEGKKKKKAKKEAEGEAEKEEKQEKKEKRSKKRSAEGEEEKKEGVHAKATSLSGVVAVVDNTKKAAGVQRDSPADLLAAAAAPEVGSLGAWD